MNRQRWAAALATVAVVAVAAGAGWWRFGRAVAVPVTTVAEGTVAVRVQGPGTVQARVPLTLAARLTATVTAVNADVGDTVQAGDLLVALDDRDLRARRDTVAAQRGTQARNIEAAEAALRKAQADLALARSRAQRDAALQAQGFVSTAGLDSTQAALDAAVAAEQSAAATLAARRAELAASAHDLAAADVTASFAQLRAPVDALVIQRLVEPGSTVVAGTPLLRLVDPASVWVAMRVDEAQLAALQPGQPARIRLRTGAEHAGRVARIARQSDPATREIEAHVAFDTLPARFAIDQQAEVTVMAGEQRGLRVPANALLRDRDGRPGVLTVTDGRARFVAVKPGTTDGEQLLLADGPAAGTAVVAVAAGVRDGMRVRAAD
ncbi:efflux RND transporter periplasmic adaptor subunit [Rubrivivax albus]|uniref:Efflux RND transporter periplasmic adaptor subunit n=1 Tax=Rubrivivax albus TaxID=2499835 RepID=A0A3S2TNL6_9BURK|nr:efflux RND transporter periplasmic adaptor subunit [Rubrivivax albus]RVT52432.1 efflux RND transporter periplasmic adaptor subunit [Rubrivivax albus]